MATDITTTSGSVVPKVVIIADNHDLTLRVTEYTKPLKAGDDGRDKIKTIVDWTRVLLLWCTGDCRDTLRDAPFDRWRLWFESLAYSPYGCDLNRKSANI
jgi:hypothetical protein